MQEELCSNFILNNLLTRPSSKNLSQLPSYDFFIFSLIDMGDIHTYLYAIPTVKLEGGLNHTLGMFSNVRIPKCLPWKSERFPRCQYLKQRQQRVELGGGTDVFSMFLPFPAKWWKTSEDKVGMKMSSLEKIHPWYCLEMFYRQPFAELCFHKNLKILMFFANLIDSCIYLFIIYLLIILLLNHSNIYWLVYIE